MSSGQKKAEGIYKMWHAKDANKAYKKSVAALSKYPNAYPIGIGHEIEYLSAKWEDREHLYIHDFDKPKIYLLENMVQEGEAIGKAVSVKSLLGVRKIPAGGLPVVQLGKCVSLSYKDADKEICDFTHMNNALLLSTLDKKALLILSKKGPILVRGGTMRVTARGVVD